MEIEGRNGVFRVIPTVKESCQVIHIDPDGKTHLGTFPDEDSAVRFIKILNEISDEPLSERQCPSMSYHMRILIGGSVRLVWREKDVNDKSSNFPSKDLALAAIENFEKTGKRLSKQRIGSPSSRNAFIYRRGSDREYFVVFCSFKNSIGYFIYPTLDSAKRAKAIFKETGEMRSYCGTT